MLNTTTQEQEVRDLAIEDAEGDKAENSQSSRESHVKHARKMTTSYGLTSQQADIYVERYVATIMSLN